MARPVWRGGIDLGSGRVTCVVGRVTDLEIEIVAADVQLCAGLSGGGVVDIESTAQAITRAVEAAEEKADQEIESFSLGIRGAHIESFNQQGAVSIARTDKEITEEDVVHVKESAKAVRLSPDREILHLIPQGFTVDKQTGVVNPVEMEGHHLQVDAHIVTASSTALNNILKALSRASVEPDSMICGVLAAGEVALDRNERDLGVVLIDIGGQTIDIAIYHRNHVRFITELSLGGDNITRDLATGMRTSVKDAQDLKERFGSAHMALVSHNEEIRYPSLDGRSDRPTHRKQICEIIQPRVDEMFEHVRAEVDRSGLRELVRGAVLTGGGSLLAGIASVASDELDMEARTGAAQGVGGLAEVVTNPSFATGIGLLRLGGGSDWGANARLPHRSRSSRGGWLKHWLEDLF